MNAPLLAESVASGPWPLLLPSMAGITYVFGAMMLKRAADLGANVWVTIRTCNFATAAVFLPLTFLGGTFPGADLLWQPALVGMLFVAGQLLSLLALSRGDVSIATPVLGLKIPVVALMVTVLVGEKLGVGLWTAAILSSVSIGLLNLSRPSAHRNVGSTIVLSAFAAVAYALCDVFVQKWSGAWGAGRFLPISMLFVATASLALRPGAARISRADNLNDARKESTAAAQSMSHRRWMWAGAFCFAGQCAMFASSIAIYRQATVANVFYSTRGLWSVVVVWLVGHWFANRERHLGARVMAGRTAGAVLMMAAICIVLLVPSNTKRDQAVGPSPTGVHAGNSQPAR